MKQEVKKWYYILFDEVKGSVYESGEWVTTRANAFQRIQDLHYAYLEAMINSRKKTAAEQLRSIIKDSQAAAILEYKLMTGRE